MAITTTSVTTTATTLDDGSAGTIWIRVTGSLRVLCTNGPDRYYLRAGREDSVAIAGPFTVVVNGADGSSSQVQWEVSTPNSGVNTVATWELAAGLVIDGGTL